MFKVLLSLFLFVFSTLQLPVAADSKPTQETPATPTPALPGIVPDEIGPSSPVTAPPSYEGAFVKMLVTLLVLLVLVFFTIWMFRRLAQGRFRSLNSARAIKIVEKRPLSPKTILYVIEVSGKQVLVSESQVEVRRLTDIEELPSDDE